MKWIVFDLDGTLCKIGKEILPETVEMLKALEDKGNRICISSGKPTYYLVGMFRQVGLKAPIFIGENGGVIQFGVDLPPHEYHVTTALKGVVRKLKELRCDLEEKFGGRIGKTFMIINKRPDRSFEICRGYLFVSVDQI